MSDVFRYSSTAGDNTNLAFGGWPEGMTRATVNDQARLNLAAIADFLTELPWLEFSIGLTITQISTTSFKIAAKDLTALYTVGRECRVRDGSTTAQGQISSSTLNGSDTDVVLTLNSGSPNVPAVPTNSEVLVLDDGANVVFFSDVAASVLAGGLYDGDNLVKDGSFEKGTSLSDIDTVDGGATGWTIAATNPRAGTNALQFDPTSQTGAASAYLNAGDRTALAGQLACSEGDALQLVAYARHSGAGAPGASLVQIGWSWRNKAGTELSSDLGTAFGSAMTTSYVEHLHVAVAPVGTVYAVPVIQIANGSPATIYHFDDVGGERLVNRSQPATITAAATINIEAWPDFYSIAVGVNIQTISGDGLYSGRTIVLKFNGAVTVVDATGNLRLQSAANFVAGADDTLTLAYDGAATWFEVARSVN